MLTSSFHSLPPTYHSISRISFKPPTFFSKPTPYESQRRRSNLSILCKMNKDEKLKAVVVGGGWAGFGAAHQLSKAGLDVTVLDASPYVGGLSGGFRTSQGRAVEAGIKGFWWQYHNIHALVDELQIDNPFTEWCASSIYTPNGLEVESPVFNQLTRLPAPFGSFLYTAPLFKTLPLADRLTALPLLRALAEYDVDDEAYAHYDSMTALELFRTSGVSSRLYKQFLKPMLLVTLFAPAENLSAAAAMAALYYYVLAHQADFDVRWCRGSIAERIFSPWVKALQSRGAKVLGGRRVQEVKIDVEQNKVKQVIAVDLDGNAEVYEPDILVFAVGVKAMQKIVASSAGLAARDSFAKILNLEGIDVMAVRLWLDKKIPLKTSCYVLAGFEPTTGATLFDLNSFQDEYKEEEGSVVEVDLYHANQWLALSDEDVVRKIKEKYMVGCVKEYADAQVLDSCVLKFKGGVTLFSPGSNDYMPSTKSSFANVFMAGDWLKQGPNSHGARGLSQEKAMVTGLLAADAGLDYLGYEGPRSPVLPVEQDEPFFALAKSTAKQFREVVRGSPLPSPFL